MWKPPGIAACLVAALVFVGCAAAHAADERFDLVIRGGRVIDPQSDLDGVRSIGIRGSRIAVVTESPLEGVRVLEAHGLVVAPGFIDLHNHAFAPVVRDSRLVADSFPGQPVRGNGAR